MAWFESLSGEVSQPIALSLWDSSGRGRGEGQSRGLYTFAGEIGLFPRPASGGLASLHDQALALTPPSPRGHSSLHN
jgi:hypothetical protein